MKKPTAKKPGAKKPGQKVTRNKAVKKALKKALPKTEPQEELTDEEKADKRNREADAARARVQRALEKFPLYYDHEGQFWFKPKDRYLKLSKQDIKEHLRSEAGGLRDNKDSPWIDGSLKEIDWLFFHAQRERVVDYAGPLAGHRCGIYKTGGKEFLITNEAEGVWADLPKPAFPPLFGSFIKALLPENQWRHFCYWLALSYLSLRNQDFKPGQCVFLVGKPKCGKSLCQLFVKLILGGRSGNPMDYMTETSEFNGDIVCSEVWAAEDPRSSSDYKSREQFGDRLKEAANNDTIRLRGMFREGIEVRIWRRVIFSLNMLPQHVQRIPPLIDGTEDKTNVYKCEDARHTLANFIVRADQGVLNNIGVPLPVGVQDRAALLRAIEAEIPLIRAWLLHEFYNVPADLVDDRADIKAWQHPDITAIINELSREAHVMSLIDTYAWSKNDPDQPPIRGTAGEIYAELLSKHANIGTIVKSPIDLGRTLEAIKQQRRDERVTDELKGAGRIWTITPPPEHIRKPQTEDPY